MVHLYELLWNIGDQTFRYIGTTSDLKQRLRGHRSNVRCGIHSSPKVAEMWMEHGEPEIRSVCEVPATERLRAEEERIREFADDPGLLNRSRAAAPSNDPRVRNLIDDRLREVCGKPVEITFPDGSTKTWRGANQAARALEVDQMTLNRWLNGSSPWPGQGTYKPRKTIAHLTGLTGRYLSPEESRDLNPST